MVENIDLTLDADRFRVSDTREYRAAISGQLRCSGALQNPLVKGTLEVVDTTLRPDLAVLKSGPAAPDETITVVQHAQELAQPSISAQEEKEKEETRPGPPIPQEGFYQKLALDIAVAIPHDTWVHMREGSIELMGNLRVKKDPEEELALSGNIETVRGWIAYQGRKFRVEKGTVVFTGATPIDPSLDLVARYTLPDYIVDVTVGGTAKSPTVNFSSQPSLEQADILSLLMFGKPANSLSQGQKTTLQSQAVQALTGAMASELGQALSESLGLDNLELDVGQNPHQSKVGAGKYVSPGVFVSTSQQLGGNGQGGQDVSIEYQLSDDWQLKASTTSKGNNGLDILWKKKY
jgi:translocation and assembly module TamB